MKSKFSIMLTAKRNEKQLTKKQTAELMGVTPMYYARFEKNNLTPSKRNLDFFADFLEIDKEELWSILEEEKNLREKKLKL